MSIEKTAHSASLLPLVRDHVATGMAAYRRLLDQLARIPSVSWPSFDQAQVQRSAEVVAQAARETGIFESVNIFREPTADGSLGQPSVIARRSARNGAPTVLLYAHHDVQPPGDESVWKTDPFVPTEVGDRLFGRGVADDKAGVVSHLAAIETVFAVNPACDIGIVLFIEGEEEYGSPSFGATLSAHKETLASDVIVVADSGNWSTDVPALTVSLRGNATIKITVETLDHAVHSGMFGGSVPDAMIPLVRILSRLHREDGSVAVSGLESRVGAVPEYSEATLREESGLLDGVSPIGHGDILDRIWNQPSITVIGLDAPATAESSNTLLPSASAMVSLRVAPGQDASQADRVLREFLAADPPLGARVTVESIGVGSPFQMEPNHQTVALVKEAMADAWGVPPIDIGVGGSIPFISDFVAEFPEAVVLVTGIEDPDTRAHSPNESLHLPSFTKAIETEALFLLRLAG
jgi:acetylornithine deacetylase/succinyl-diaminopimelate desuccinylase-like protein